MPPAESTSSQGRKLGITTASEVVSVNAPATWHIDGGHPVEGLDVAGLASWTPSANPVVTIAFARSIVELDLLVDAFGARGAEFAPLWLCWPRRAGGHTSDLSDQVVRQAGLSLGLVDNKVAAVDDDWSGLRFARRRPGS